MFSETFYIFFWKINLFLLRLGELLGHKSTYVMAISGQMVPAEALAWLFIWVLSHEITLLSILVKGILLLAYFLQSRQKGIGEKSLCSSFCYWTILIPDTAPALWNWLWVNGNSGVLTSWRQDRTSDQISLSWIVFEISPSNRPRRFFPHGGLGWTFGGWVNCNLFCVSLWKAE